MSLSEPTFVPVLRRNGGGSRKGWEGGARTEKVWPPPPPLPTEERSGRAAACNCVSLSVFGVVVIAALTLPWNAVAFLPRVPRMWRTFMMLRHFWQILHVFSHLIRGGGRGSRSYVVRRQRRYVEPWSGEKGHLLSASQENKAHYSFTCTLIGLVTWFLGHSCGSNRLETKGASNLNLALVSSNQAGLSLEYPISFLLAATKAGNDCRKLPLKIAEDREEKEEATRLSVDAAGATVWSEPDGVFTVKEEERHWRLGFAWHHRLDKSPKWLLIWKVLDRN